MAAKKTAKKTPKFVTITVPVEAVRAYNASKKAKGSKKGK